MTGDIVFRRQLAQERHDLAPTSASRVEELRTALTATVKRAVKERVTNNLATIPPEVREQLRALGYIE